MDSWRPREGGGGPEAGGKTRPPVGRQLFHSSHPFLPRPFSKSNRTVCNDSTHYNITLHYIALHFITVIVHWASAPRGKVTGKWGRNQKQRPCTEGRSETVGGDTGPGAHILIESKAFLETKGTPPPGGEEEGVQPSHH